MSEVILTNQNFKEEIKEGLVLVDFFATWCGPCKMMEPVISKIAEEYKGKVKVCKLNVDDENELAIQYGISSIPTLILFKDGKQINSLIGLSSKSEIDSMINNI